MEKPLDEANAILTEVFATLAAGGPKPISTAALANKHWVSTVLLPAIPGREQKAETKVFKDNYEELDCASGPPEGAQAQHEAMVAKWAPLASAAKPSAPKVERPRSVVIQELEKEMVAALWKQALSRAIGTLGEHPLAQELLPEVCRPFSKMAAGQPPVPGEEPFTADDIRSLKATARQIKAVMEAILDQPDPATTPSR